MLAALGGTTTLHAADAPAAKPAVPAIKLPPQPPDVAAQKMDPKTGQVNAGFIKSHESFVKVAQ